MNTLKTIGISALVALIVATGIWLVLPAKTPVVGANALLGNVSVDGSQSNLPNPSNSDYEVARLALGLGTNSTPINIEGQRMALVAATTTPCAIQNPFNATSTVQNVTINVASSSASSEEFSIATSTTAFNASSIYYGATLAANAMGTFMAGETASSTGLGVVLPPTGWVVMTLASATSFGGTCTAVFQSI